MSGQIKLEKIETDEFQPFVSPVPPGAGWQIAMGILQHERGPVG